MEVAMARTRHIARTEQDVVELMFNQQMYAVGKQYPKMDYQARLDLATKRARNLYLIKKKAELK